ncbi:cytochrome c-type biogenesis protein CcmH [Novosphingobium sp. PhB165]|uniref:tetratricopeptide repeat protein n=1 Tax=Novosphingobium sp. PhB165 TaxID=2485105 RepID=UPI00104ABD81|nr:cytochrome C biosynthesis protein [Novosphingobium sp. PhB165]TCM21618.1 cytochrome c-type biogenesis protein CcmH [Novosphingobium sp. PhB165]
MTWVFVILLAVAAFLLVVFVFKAPRGGREAIAAALALGIAGYAAQGTPAQPGAPKDGAEGRSGDMGAFFAEARATFSSSGLPPSDRWVVIADGLARHGEYGDAAEVLRGAIGNDPPGPPANDPDTRERRSEAWLSLGNALVAHAEGQLTPASLYAYRRAGQADPDAAGPPFFLGLALAQSGRLGEGRAMWADLLARAPKEAKWRPVLEQQLIRLDAFIAAQNGSPARPPAGAANSVPAPAPQ